MNILRNRSVFGHVVIRATLVPCVILLVGCGTPPALVPGKLMTVRGDAIPKKLGHRYVQIDEEKWKDFYPPLSAEEQGIIRTHSERIRKTRVAVVCSGGGLNLVLLIGALRALEEYGFGDNIVALAGTSGGSIWTGAYAVGINTQDMTAFACSGNKHNYWRLHPDLPPPHFMSVFRIIFRPFATWRGVGRVNGILQGDYFGETLHQLLGDATFADCKRTLRIATVDVGRGRALIYGNRFGSWRNETPNVPVYKAVQASCSIPLVFTPAVFKGPENVTIYHWDGGLVYNLPIREFLSTEVDLLVVCAVNAPTPAEIRGQDLAMPPPVDPSKVSFNQKFGIVTAMQDGIDIMLRESIKKDLQFCYQAMLADPSKRKPIIIMNTFSTVGLDESDEVPGKILEGYDTMRGCLSEFLRDMGGKGVYSNHRYQ